MSRFTIMQKLRCNGNLYKMKKRKEKSYFMSTVRVATIHHRSVTCYYILIA